MKDLVKLVREGNLAANKHQLIDHATYLAGTVNAYIADMTMPLIARGPSDLETVTAELETELNTLDHSTGAMANPVLIALIKQFLALLLEQLLNG